MYLAEVHAENFRIYGAKAKNKDDEDRSLHLRLSKGLSVLIGENDSGKTAIIDAIRLCLQTSASDYHRVTEDDFYCDKNGRASSFSITCKFEDLTTSDQGAFYELLHAPRSEQPTLYVTFKAELLQSDLSGRVSISTRTGPSGDGPAIEGAVREMLRATYLKPLRDAEAELRPGRGSRISQILASYPHMAAEGVDDFNPDEGTAETLVGLFRKAEHAINNNATISKARADINSNYLGKFSIGADELSSIIKIANDTKLSKVLERLELRFDQDAATAEWTKRGLGYNNALFMAAELLLLSNNAIAPVLLIEEPEAHLHPQLQARVIELLTERAAADDPVQVILTTHSPNIAASLPVERLIIVSHGQTYSLEQSQTKLDASDYAFLGRFLDVTKANLFFARAVVIVEGDAEALLLPALAKAAGRPFGKAGVSIVNVALRG